MEKNNYDIIIIGSGIAGLVCGAYLTKNGKKILILEKNSIPGGLCTSFNKRGFTFDTGVHYLSSCRHDGYLGRMFVDLGIEMDFLKLNPTDSVIIGDKRINFNRCIEDIENQFYSFFPSEKNIRKFLSFLISFDINNKMIISKYFYELRNQSFQDLLNRFFESIDIKNFFSFFLFNIGLHPKEANALYSLYLIKEFIFDGGFYPRGGLRSFPEALVKTITAYGGKVLFKSQVRKINLENGFPVSVEANSELFFAKNFIVNSDVTELFFNLIGEELLPANFVKNLRSLKYSRSLFLVHLALKNKLNSNLNCTWYSQKFNLDAIYDDLLNKKIVNTSYVFCFFPSLVDSTLAPSGKECGYLAVITPYYSKEFWSEVRRAEITDKMLNIAEEIHPDLRNNLDFTFTSTPDTFFRYTGNFKGAAYGWASLVGMESKENYASFKTPFSNLFICSHWATRGIGYGGIPMVVYSGMQLSEALLKN